MAGAVENGEPLLGAGSGHHHEDNVYSLRTGFSGSASVLLVALVALFAALVRYPNPTFGNDAQLNQYYMW